jgi:hypothetical protein
MMIVVMTIVAPTMSVVFRPPRRAVALVDRAVRLRVGASDET